MVAELIVRLNSANEYNIDAQGKDLISININTNDILHKEIIDGKLVITTSTGKKINLSNFESLSRIKTLDNADPMAIILDDSAKNSVTNPISSLNYVGTGLDDNIDAHNGGQAGYWHQVKRGKKKVNEYVNPVGVTINAGDGNDTIQGSAYNDNITGGRGTNTYIIDTENNFGTDTINLRDDEIVKFQLKTSSTESQQTSLQNIEIINSGSDLVITVYKEQTRENVCGKLILKDFFQKYVTIKGYDNRGLSDEYELKDQGKNVQTIIAEKYANYLNELKENDLFQANQTYYGTMDGDTIDASGANQYHYTHSWKVKKRWYHEEIYTQNGVTIKSGDGTDTIIGSDFNDTIYGGFDNDTITGGKGSDYIEAGAGTNTLIFTDDFGNDTVKLTEGEKLTLDLSAYTSITEENVDEKVSYTQSGNDLIITVKDGDTVKGTINLKDFWKEDETSYVKLKLANDGEKTLTNATVKAINSSNYSTVNSRFDENIIDATNASEIMGARTVKKGKKKVTYWDVHTGLGATIKGGDKADTITGSKFNDNISGGKGINVLNIKTQENFGDDTYYLTEGESLTIKLDGAATVNKEFVGKNLKLTVIDGTTPRGTLTLSNFGAITDFTKYGDLKIVVPGSADFNLKEDLAAIINTDIDLSGNNRNYTGTFLDEEIDASNVQQVMAARTVKQGRKKITVWDVETHIGATIDAGGGTNTITGSIYNDTIIGGKGTNTLNISADKWFGEDVYYMTEGETLKIKLTGAPTDTVTVDKKISGNNLELIVKDGETVRGKLTLVNFAQIDLSKSFEIKIYDIDGITPLDGGNLKDITSTSYSFGNNQIGSYTGTSLNDTINAELGGLAAHSERYKKGKKWVNQWIGDQGVTIDGGKGDDTITGSRFNDVIVGGEGKNIIELNIDASFGNDTYYLTQGETLKLQYKGLASTTGSVEYKINNNDLIISVYGLKAGAESRVLTGTLTVKNFAKEDISNAIQLYTQNQDPTDDNVEPIDVKAQLSASEDTTLYGAAYHVGTRFDDYINASQAGIAAHNERYKKGKKWYNRWVNEQGVIVYGGKGEDTIVGSNYSDQLYGGDDNDTINGGAGNDYIEGGDGADILNGDDGSDTILGGAGGDTITGGKGDDFIYGGEGNNTLVFKIGDGKDTVYSDGGVDTLDFADIENFKDLVVISNGKDLIIKHSGEDYVVLNNYLTNTENSVKNIKTQEGTLSFTTFIDNYNAGVYNNSFNTTPREFATMGSGIINGTDGNNEIVASAGNDTINMGAGNDVVYASKGNDIINGGAGNKTIVYDVEGFGTDWFNLADGENLTLDLTYFGFDKVNYAQNGNDLTIITEQGNIILSGFAANNVVGDGGSVKLKLSDETEGTIDLNTDVLDRFTVARSYTGTRLNEYIDASNVTEEMGARSYKDKKKKWHTVYDVHTGRGATISTIAGTNTVVGSGLIDNITAGSGNDTIYAGAGNDTIKGGTGTGTLSGGEGIDTININNGGSYTVYGNEGNDTINTGKGTHTIVFSSGDGNDKIYSAKNAGAMDTLKFNGVDNIDNLTFARYNLDLIITYSDNETVTVYDYFVKNGNDCTIDENHSVKKVLIGETETDLADYLLDDEHPERLKITGVGKIEGSDSKKDWILGSSSNDDIYGYGKDDTINAGLGNNNIYTQGGGNDTIKNGGGNDTIIFEDGIVLDNDNFGFEDNNLVITYGTNNENKVTIENFKTGDYSVRNVRFGGKTYDINYFLSEKFGSNRDDSFVSTNKNETFNLNAGNDTITFDRNFGVDIVRSIQETDENSLISNTDALIFKNSIADNNLDIDYDRNDTGVVDGIMIVANDNQTQENLGRVTYQGIINGTTPNLVIKDNSNRSWKVNSYNDIANVDWSGDRENHIVFIQDSNNEDKNYVISNTGYNVIRTSAGIGKNTQADAAGLEYTYKGGRDRVATEAVSDDVYHIDTFTSNSSLTIKDYGGEDTISINTNAANIRFLFNVENNDVNYTGNHDEAWEGNDSLFIIHKDSYNTETVMKCASGADPFGAGIITVKLNGEENDITTSIEHIRTVDFVRDIQLSEWFDGIEAKVLAWLKENNFASTKHVFDEGTKAQIEEILNIYRGASYQAIIFNGTDGDDTIIGSINADDITGGKGSNRIVFNGENFGADTINLTETEKLTLDLTAFNFTADDIEYSYSSDDLLISTLNGSIRLNNFKSTDVTGDTGSVKLLLKNAVLDEFEQVTEEAVEIDLREKTYDVTVNRLYDGTWHNENIDASNVVEGKDTLSYTERYKQGGKWKTRTVYYEQNNGKGATITTGGGINIVTGSDFIDDITAGSGDDTINAGAGNDTIKGGTGTGTLTGGEGSDTITAEVGNYIINGDSGNDIITTGSGTYEINGGADSDTITTGAGNNTIDTGIGNDTLNLGTGTNVVNFSAGDGVDTITSYSGNNTLVFKNFANLTTLKANLSLAYDGTNRNFIIRYSDNDSVIIPGYDYNNVPQNDFILRSLDDTEEAKISLGDFIAYYQNSDTGRNEKIIITGSGVIDGTVGDDKILSSSLNDTITGNTGRNTIIFNGENFGNDTVELTETENLTLDLTAFNFTENDVTYSYSGDDLLISTPNGSIKLNDFISEDVTGDAGSVKLLLKNAVLDEFEQVAEEAVEVDLRAKTYDITVNREYSGTWHNENIDASAVIEGTDTLSYTERYKQGGKWKTRTVYYQQNNGKGATIITNEGNNIVTGSNFIDNITAGSGDDTINAGAGNDTINGGTGTGILSGGEGNDTINGGNGEYTLKGDAGDDTINAGSGTNTIDGGAGNDTINLEAGTNTLIFDEGSGSDTIILGTGTNKFVFNNLESLDSLNLAYDGTNNNFVISYTDNDKIKIVNYDYSNPPQNDFVLKAGEDEKILGDFITYYRETLHKEICITGEGVINGTTGNDTIYGSENADIINSNGGKDLIYGFGGNDEIHGETGTHTIYGGDGNDKIYGGDNYYFDSNLKSIGNKLYGGDGNDEIHAGTAFYTEMYGGDGNDKIYDNASGYKNIINGGAGNDEIYLQSAATVVVNSDCGNDVIDFGGYYNTITLMFADVANQAALGESINMVKLGSSYQINYGNNSITLNNLPFNNCLKFKTADENDTGVTLTSWFENHPLPITGTEGDDWLYGDNNDNVIYGLGGSDTIYAQKGNDTVYGGSGNDYISGDDGNDILNGEAGNDRIEGNRGDDTITGGTGNNTLVFSSGDGDDIVMNSDNGTDTLQINAEIKKISQRGNDLIIKYGNSDSITVKNYFSVNHSVKSLISWGEYSSISIDAAIAKYGSGTVDNVDTLKASRSDQNVNVILGEGNTVNGTTGGINYIFGDSDGSVINAGTGDENRIFGGKGNDVINAGVGYDYIDAGAGSNIINISKGGSRDYMAEAGAEADNTLVFRDVTFSVENGRVTGLGALTITNDPNNSGYATNHITIKGYGYDSDNVIFQWYFQTGDGYLYDYSGYKLKDSQGNVISLADAIKLSKNNLIFDGSINSAGFDETIYTASTDNKYIGISNGKKVSYQQVNGIARGNEGNDTIYSGGIYQPKDSDAIHPSITAGGGNDVIHAEGNKLYVTTNRTDLTFITQPDEVINADQDYVTRVYNNTDHIYITPDKKVVKGFFFFAYTTETDAYGRVNVTSYQLEGFPEGDYYGTYNYEGINVYVYRVDNLMDARIEGKKTYLFDYGDKIASGQVTVSGDDGDDLIYIGNGSAAEGGAGNDTIIGDGTALGGDGNDKIYMNDDNHYMDGYGFTEYNIDGGAGNDFIDISDIKNRAKDYEVINFSSGDIVYGEDDIVEIRLSDKGINTVLMDPKTDKPIVINLQMYNNRNLMYGTRIGDTDAAFGVFRRGDDLYIAANNTSNKAGVIVIKDYYAILRDEHGEPILDENDNEIPVFTDERKASIKVYYEPSIRDFQSASGYPMTYIPLEDFISHYNDFKDAQVDQETGMKNYDYYTSQPFKWGVWTNTTRETNVWYTFIDNQGVGESIIQPVDIHNIKEVQVAEEESQYSSTLVWTIKKQKFDSPVFVIGGDGAQTIYGTNADDVIYGDNIGSHNTATGDWTENHTNDGNDKIYAGKGDDYVEGGSGDDLIVGGEGSNVLLGGDGNDTIVAGEPTGDGSIAYDSYAYGEGGNDNIYSHAVLDNNEVDEEASQTYLGGEVNTGRNYLYGGDGNDNIYANGYQDIVDAGAGNDKVYLYSEHGDWRDNSTAEISLGDGDDEFYATGAGQFTVYGNSGNNLIDASNSTANYNNLKGGTGYDTIKGGSGMDYITTGSGGAKVEGGAGDDDISGIGELHGGIGNDIFHAEGRSTVYGEEGNDKIYLGDEYSDYTTALTVDGGVGDDSYIAHETNGFNTLIASEGNDVIKILNVKPGCITMYKRGNDAVLSRTSATSNVGSLIILKDYYSGERKYGANHDKTAAELFENWTVETYSGRENSAKRGVYTLADFIDYASGNIDIITNGDGTDGNDIIESSENATSIDGKAGNDTIVSGSGAATINGGAGNDFIIGSSERNYEGKHYQFIYGDNGNANPQEQYYYHSETGEQLYSLNYWDTNYSSSDNSHDGNDTITAYASHTYIWGEGGDDVITVASDIGRVWGGSGNDTINVNGQNSYGDSANAAFVFGESGEDNIKGRIKLIDGGDDNDNIVHKFYTAESNNNEQKAIIKKQYGITDAQYEEFTNIGYNDIRAKYTELKKNMAAISSDEYWIASFDDPNADLPTDGDKAYWQRTLDADKAVVYGTKNTYEEYYNSLTEEEKANAKYSLEFARYQSDLDKKALYQSYVDNYDDKTFLGYTFRNEGDKAYWQWKLNVATHSLNGGYEGTRAAYERIHSYVDNYDELASYTKAYFEEQLATAEEHKNHYNNYDMTSDEATAEYDNAKYLLDNYDTVVNHTKEYWQAEEQSAYTAYQYDLNLYNKYVSYRDNYYNAEFLGEDYVCTIGKGYQSFREEGEANKRNNGVESSGKIYWQEKVEEVRKSLEGVTEGSYDFYQYALARLGSSAQTEAYNKWRADVSAIREANYNVNNWYLYEDENYVAPQGTNYQSYRDEGDKEYWQAKYDAQVSLIYESENNVYDRWEAINGLYNPDPELYAATEAEYNAAMDKLNTYERYVEWYDYDDGSTFRNYRKDEYEADIVSIDSSIDGAKLDYEKAYAALMARVDAFKATLTEDQIRLLDNYGANIILGGKGNDEITIGHVDEDDKSQTTGTAYTSGQEGDDKYIIESYYSSKNDVTSRTDVLIYDVQGTNTVKLNSEIMTSGNIGVWANIWLDKDNNGDYIVDSDGNYQYSLRNFGTGVDMNGVTTILDGSNSWGDSGYSVMLTDLDSYKSNYYYGGSGVHGVKFDKETMNHFDKIEAYDGKYITKDQLNAVFQNAANWLAQNGYDNYLEAVDSNINDSSTTSQQNLTDLESHLGFGRLDWIEEGDEDIVPKTEGTEGSNASDDLTSTAADENFNLKNGFDRVTFTGEFGNDTITSSSTKDLEGNARQVDTINLEDYSVSGGTLKFTQSGKDLVMTAYKQNGDAAGTVTYKDFLGDEYTSRYFVLNAADHQYMVGMIDSASIYNNYIDEDKNSYYNIKFVCASDGNRTTVEANGNRSYYYTIGESSIKLQPDDNTPVEVYSNGETADDHYRLLLGADSNFVIHDNGGNDVFNSRYGGWFVEENAVYSSQLRLLFDVVIDGETGEATVPDVYHYVWKNSYMPKVNNETTYDVENIQKLLNKDVDHPNGAVTIYGNIERVMTDDHYDLKDNVWTDAQNDLSMSTSKYVQAILKDIVDYLKANDFTSVSDVLDRGTDEQKNEILAMYDVAYDPAIYRNMYGTDGNDTIELNYSYTTNSVEGKKGNDKIVIDNYGNHAVNIIYNYAPENGDGHDTILNSGNNDSITVYRGQNEMFTKFRSEGWDLRVEFYSNNEATSNPQGSILIKDYFKKSTFETLDTITIKSQNAQGEPNADEVISIKEIILDPEKGVINSDAILGTVESDTIDGTDGNDSIYPLGMTRNGADDIINSSKGDDTIYLSEKNRDGVGYNTNGWDNTTTVKYSVVDGVNNHGNDKIYGANNRTRLYIDYGDTYAQTEYRQKGNDLVILFYMGEEGNQQNPLHKVGSVTVTNFNFEYQYGTSFDNVTVRTNAGGEKQVSVRDLMADYVARGGSLVDNEDTPYLNTIYADTTKNTVLTNTGKLDTLVFTDVEKFSDLNCQVSGDDLVITHSGVTTTVKDFAKGDYSVSHIRVGETIKSINETNNIPNIQGIRKLYGVEYNGDNLFIPNGVTELYRINTDGYDDVIASNNLNNTIIVGENSNDYFEVTGSGNTFYGGTGNDTFNINTNGTNTFVFEKNTRNDYINNDTLKSTGGNAVLKFVDSAASDLTLVKFGKDLIIKYNDGKDSVTIRDYYVENNTNSTFTIVDKDKTSVSLAQFITNYKTTNELEDIPVSDITTIQGSYNDDYIYIPKGIEGITKIDTRRSDNNDEGDDTVIGAINNAEIITGYGNDHIEITGHGNIIKGGLHNDVYEITTDNTKTGDGVNYSNTLYFDWQPGQDIIQNCSGKILIHIDTNYGHSIERLGDDLLIKWYSSDHFINIKEYFKENGCNKDAIFSVKKYNDEVVSLDTFINNYLSTHNPVFDEVPLSEMTQISGNEYADTILIPEGSGINRVDAGQGRDVITGTVNNAQINGDNHDDIINITGHDNIITGGRHNDRINVVAGNGQTNTLKFDNGHGSDVVNAIGGNAVLEFINTTFDDIQLEKFNDYLIIRYNSRQDMIYLQGYFDSNVNNAAFSLKDKDGNVMTLDDFINDKYANVTGINAIYGKDYDEKYYHTQLDNTVITYNLQKGNDTLEFEAIANKSYDKLRYDINRKAIINSLTEKDAQDKVLNTDKIILDGYSEKDVTFGFSEDGSGITIHAEKDYSYYDGDESIGGYSLDPTVSRDVDITYNNYLTGDTPDLIVHSNYDYTVKRFDGVQNYGMISDPDIGGSMDAMYINASTGTSTIGTIMFGAYSQVLTTGGANLDYYNFGVNGTVVTNSAASNDRYTLDYPYSTALHIIDKGGDDTIVLNDIDNREGCKYAENIRLLFNVNKDGSTDNKFAISLNQSGNSLETDAARILSGKEILREGTIFVEADKTNNQYVGIEHLSLNGVVGQNSITGYSIEGHIADVDLNAWYDAIKQDVSSWLSTTDYGSTAEVFERGCANSTDTDFQNLIAIYDRAYNNLNPTQNPNT